MEVRHVGEALDVVAQKMQKSSEYGRVDCSLHHGIGARFILHVLKSYGAINMEPVVRAVPWPRATSVPAHFRHRLGSPEPPTSRTPTAWCWSARIWREHAQLAGAGIRPGDRAADPDHRRRSALLDSRQQAKYWLPIKRD